MSKFINRVRELKILEEVVKQSGMAVLFGRRRIGKTALVKKLSQEKPAFYSQALEAAPFQQINQIVQDFNEQGMQLPESISDWNQFFSFLKLQTKKMLLIFDEFQFFCHSDRSFASRMQIF